MGQSQFHPQSNCCPWMGVHNFCMQRQHKHPNTDFFLPTAAIALKPRNNEGYWKTNNQVNNTKGKEEETEEEEEEPQLRLAK